MNNLLCRDSILGQRISSSPQASFMSELGYRVIKDDDLDLLDNIEAFLAVLKACPVEY
jgi:hypothetical protein